MIFHQALYVFILIYMHLSNSGWLLSSKGRIPILPPCLSSRDLQMEGSAVLSSHLPGTAPQASWGKFDGQF